MPNPDHRRARLLEPTPAGRRVMAVVVRRHEAWARRLAGGLRADEVAAASRVIHQLGERLRDLG